MIAHEPTRRLGSIRINPDSLLGLGKVHGVETVGTPIPPDARVIHRAIDERGDLVLVVESECYPECHEGSWPMPMPGLAFRRPQPPPGPPWKVPAPPPGSGR